MNDDRIYDRVAKLLRLADHNDSEAEAALAAARAAELMHEHNLTEAEVRLVEGGETRPAEPIVKDFVVDASTKQRVAWRGTVAAAVARSMGCRMWWRRATIHLFGRQSAVQACSYTCQYLWREVDRLADAAWQEIVDRGNDQWHTARGWKHSFRVGCSVRLAERLDESAKRERAERRSKIAPAIPALVPVNSRALAVVERDEEEVEREYAAFSQRFGRARRMSYGRALDGYSAGRSAAGTVSIGRRAAGLPAPPSQLRGGK